MSKPKDQRYVHKPLDRYGFIVDVGYYKRDGGWVPAPRIKGFMNYGGLLSGPRWGYDKVQGCATFIGSTATSSMMSPSSSMDGRDMATDDIKLSRAASEYIERRAAFWLMENQPNLEPQEIVEETLNPCIEALFAEWTELIQDAVETVNEKLGFSIQLRISVAKVRDDFAFLQGTGMPQ